MSERVHPTADDPPSAETSNPLLENPSSPKPTAPGTYIVQVPKDQIYRVPSPENARRSQKRQKPRQSRCRCCICWILGLIVLFIFALAIAAGILYLVFRPKAPKYSVESLSVRGFNVSTSQTISPEFDVTVIAENPNKNIGIYYKKGSSITVSYADVALSNGVLPTFYQGSKNVTVFRTVLTGEGIRLSSAMNEQLTADQSRGEIPFELDLRVPVKIKFGAVKTWKITVKVGCDLTVDKLTENLKIVSNKCKVKVDVF